MSSRLRQTIWVSTPPGFNAPRIFFRATPGIVKNIVPKRANAKSYGPRRSSLHISLEEMCIGHAGLRGFALRSAHELLRAVDTHRLAARADEPRDTDRAVAKTAAYIEDSHSHRIEIPPQDLVAVTGETGNEQMPEPFKFVIHACRFERLAHVLRLLLLTLQRRGELVAAEWREFNFKARTWTIPADHTKTGKGQVLPLSDWAIRELQSLKEMAGESPYVFPSSDGTAPLDPKYITRSVARCLKRFKKHGIAKFTAHDLRRTGRTGLARLGVKIDIAERVLNHTRARIEATYDLHDYLDEKRQALEKWAEHLKGLASLP